jgi:SAM-dependent methyltransferase
MNGFYATIARYYDAEHQDKTDDLLMYSQLAAEHGGPIFELAAGTGRVLIHLAQEGHDVHGVDIEPAMLDRARRKIDRLPHLRERISLHQADMLKFTTDQKFKLVIAPYGALLHFHEQAKQLELLRRLRALTANDGLLVLDLPNPGDSFGAQDTDAMLLDKTFVDPETGHLIMQYSVSRLDRTEQLLHVTWIYDEVDGDGLVHRTFAPITFRYFFHYEVRLLLALTGFETQAVYGSADLESYVDGCERLIVLAKPV